VAAGTESGGTLVVTIGSGNSAVGAVSRYTKTLSTWSYAATNGTDTSAGLDWSVTTGADPGVLGGDILYACSAINGNTSTWSAEAITQTGITMGAQTEQREGAASEGDDSQVVISNHVVSSGTSSAAPVFTMTSSVTSGSTPAGATVLLRLRETSAASCTGGLLLLGAGKC
jgi:MSHA biogenesis protein MshQ